jgi:hypothetical protein
MSVISPVYSTNYLRYSIWGIEFVRKGGITCKFVNLYKTIIRNNHLMHVSLSKPGYAIIN